jgi:hypothetical protein
MDFIKDLWGYLKEHKKWWLTPLILMLILLGLLIVVGTSSPLAPIVYTVF